MVVARNSSLVGSALINSDLLCSSSWLPRRLLISQKRHKLPEYLKKIFFLVNISCIEPKQLLTRTGQRGFEMQWKILTILSLLSSLTLLAQQPSPIQKKIEEWQGKVERKPKEIIVEYEKILEIFATTQDKLAYLDLIILAGEAYYRDWQHDTAYIYLDRAKKYANDNGLSQRLARIQNIRAWVKVRQEKFQESLAIFDEATQLNNNQDLALQANIHYGIATANHYMGKVDLALEHNKKGIAAAESMTGSKSQHMKLRRLSEGDENIAIIHHLRGELEQALHYYLKSLKNDEILDNKYRMASKLNNIGYVHQTLGSYDRAREYYQRSLELNKSIKDQKLMWTTMQNLSDMGLAEKNFKQAREFAKKAVDAASEINYRSGLAHSSSTLGAVYLEEKNYKEALVHLLKARKVLKEIDRKMTIILNLLRLGDAQMGLNNMKAAEQYYLESLSIAEKANFLVHQKQSIEKLTKFYKKSNNLPKALEFQERLYGISQKLHEKNRESAMAEMDKKYESDIKNQKIQILQKENEVSKLAEERERDKLTYSLAVVGLLFLIILFIWNRYKIKNRSHAMITRKNDELYSAYNKIRDSYAKIEQGKLKIKNQYREISNLLDNMAQAIFVIDDDYIIKSPVSKYSQTLFKSDIVGKTIFETIYKDVPAEGEIYANIKTMMKTSFGSQQIQWDINEDKLPTNVVCSIDDSRRHLKVHYTPLFNEQEELSEIMLVIEDQTDLMAAQAKLNKEKEHNDEVQRILQNFIRMGFHGVKEFMGATSEILNEVIQEIFNQENEESYLTIMRALHTLKGNARLQGLSELSGQIHLIEQNFMETKDMDPEAKRQAMTENLLLICNIINRYGEIGLEYFHIPNIYFMATLQNLNDNLNRALERLFADTKIHLTIQTTLGICSFQLESIGLRYLSQKLVGAKTKTVTSIAEDIKTVKDLIDKDPDIAKRAEEIVDSDILEVYSQNVNGLKAIIEENIDQLDIKRKIMREVNYLDSIPIEKKILQLAPMVEEVSERLAKDAKLVVNADHLTLSKRVAASLCDSLTHLVRNSIDHGIEEPEERLARGKNKYGQIEINVSCIGDQVSIVVKDDGKGLDQDLIISKAKAAGIINDDQSISQEQAYQLIFNPNFSTKEIVTEISGRGIGMSAVKESIEKLGGTIVIETVQNQGTTFQIKFMKEHNLTSSYNIESVAL